ncbi:hypothetical protein CEUSTIGMA_g9965.t1 [Chlamydomonas eustigma]|uniref:Uncharacterized protein n=1 Tax=Chlamydomonas eustigma TaxID=1157962 RepID=A0A250XHI7_9CHLO|nr:hypothetical protein CEUSTIGMA_g9965.t1 [Chlamydomonas eustigma]|eukprot:GAX82538.1 hypothetical protein CEUSTIGMA_g9965.t1 [Chlamydomonas eustigma]
MRYLAYFFHDYADIRLSDKLNTMTPQFDWNAPSCIFMTGGGSGIGLALAIRFLTKGHDVLICGRRKDVLDAAAKKHPGLIPFVGDVSTEEGRKAIADRIISEFPSVNVLINNAGIQNRLPPLLDPSHAEGLWYKHKQELAINLEAPIHLSMLLIQHLKSKSNAMIMNVTSGLAFVPIAFMPVYCTTKAGLHSFTLSLRHQLKDTPISVVELAPPAVNTDLGGPGLHTFGANVDEFTDSVFARMVAGEVEVGFGTSEKSRKFNYEEREAAFKHMNSASH